MFNAHLHSRGEKVRASAEAPPGLILTGLAATVASTCGNFASAFASGEGKRRGDALGTS